MSMKPVADEEVAALPAVQKAFDVSVGDIMLNAPLLAQIDRMAEVMASAKATIPKHLAGSRGDCWAVIMQAIQWRMNPFVVAQKTHLVNGTLGYEAQLVNAVIQASGMIDGRFYYEYAGEGAELRCRVGAVIAGESDITWTEWLDSKTVKVKNSPLWQTNPKQQMGYLQLKNWARLYCPGAILGVYTAEELRDYPVQEREVNPAAAPPATLNTGGSRTEALKSKLGVVVEAEEEVKIDIVEDDAGYAVNEQEAELDIAEDLTYAQVTEELNAADSPQALQGVVRMMMMFISHPGNEKFKEELGEAYRHRLATLKAEAQVQE